MLLERNAKDMQAIIEQARNGDKGAFGVLYEEYYTPVYRFISYRVSSKNDAEELAQDVFVKALGAFGRYEARTDTPLPYFYTIARNTLIDWQKKKKTVSVDEEVFTFLADTEAATDGEAIRNEEFSALRKALTKLPDDQREALELRFVGEHSGREVAQLMGKSEEAVRQLQSRGLKALQAHYKEEYGAI